MLRCIGEVLGVLRRRVLRPVGGSVADDHHDRTVGVDPLGRAEEVNAVVGDQVREVVLGRREEEKERDREREREEEKESISDYDEDGGGLEGQGEGWRSSSAKQQQL